MEGNEFEKLDTNPRPLVATLGDKTLTLKSFLLSIQAAITV